MQNISYIASLQLSNMMNSILYTYTLFPVSYFHSLLVSVVGIVTVTIAVGLTASIVSIIV